MTRTFQNWLPWKWRRTPTQNLLQAYQVTFSTAEGRLVLQNLLDEIYCDVCMSKDPSDLAAHNAGRAVVQGILDKIDMAESPDKYIPREDLTHAT